MDIVGFIGDLEGDSPCVLQPLVSVAHLVDNKDLIILIDPRYSMYRILPTFVSFYNR